jgi:glucose/arabinose dehydrogenase
VTGLAAAVALSGVGAPAAHAAGPPPPQSSNGHAVVQVAAGLPAVTTSFAFGDGQVFAGNEGSETGSAPGGVFLLRHGSATLLPGSPGFVFGLAWHQGTLYISSGSQLLAWSDWTGSEFAHQRTIYTAPRGFGDFNGLGFGANGRLYAGVDTGNSDHGPSNTPFARDILSFTATGRDLRIVARGIRQPWQLAFPAGSSSPYVSDLGQDTGAINPPDFLLRVNHGDNYGFPRCNWTTLAACSGFQKPFRFFTAHTDAMGLGILNGRLYISEFGALRPAQVVSMPLRGGPLRPLLTGFVAPIVGLAINRGSLYVGELTGQVFRVRP